MTEAIVAGNYIAIPGSFLLLYYPETALVST